MIRENWKSKYFTPSEWECHCGCGQMQVNDAFLEMLEYAREIAETIDEKSDSFIITSGCRCIEHNKNIGGKMYSAHRVSKELSTHGVDLSITDDHKRAIILLSLVKAGFTHIGIGSNFIHVDDSEKQGVWLYK